MKRPLPLLAVLTLTAALTAGTPVPRAVRIGAETCQTLCPGTEKTPPCPGAEGCATVLPCTPCPPDDCDDDEMKCELCVRCQCALAELAPPLLLSSPLDDEVKYFRGSDPFDSVEGEPASPPPKSA